METVNNNVKQLQNQASNALSCELGKAASTNRAASTVCTWEGWKFGIHIFGEAGWGETTSTGHPGTCYVDQPNFELAKINLLLPPSASAGIKGMCHHAQQPST